MANLLDFIGMGPKARQVGETARESAKLELDAKRRGLLLGEQLGDLVSGRTGSGTSATLPGMGLLDLEGGVTELPGRRQQIPAINTPQGQQQMMGILAQIAPQQLAQGILAQQFPAPRENETLDLLAAAGIDPTSDFGRQLIQDKIRGGSDIETRRDLLNLEELVRDLARDEQEFDQNTSRQRNSLRRGGVQVESLAKRVDRLTGTFLQTGLPLGQLRRGGAAVIAALSRATGGNPSDLEQMVADYDLSVKGLQELVNQTMDQFGSQMTNDKLDALTRASANENISPPAILEILQTIAGIQLENADIGIGGESVRMTNRDWLETFSTEGLGGFGDGDEDDGPPPPPNTQRVPPR